jgi:hypothetical protein
MARPRPKGDSQGCGTHDAKIATLTAQRSGYRHETERSRRNTLFELLNFELTLLEKLALQFLVLQSLQDFFFHSVHLLLTWATAQITRRTTNA